MDFVEAQHAAGHHGPQILGHVLDKGAKELAVFCIPAACHVQNSPEEHWLGPVAFVGLLSAQDGEKGVEVLQEPGGFQLSFIIFGNGGGELEMMALMYLLK